MNVNTQIREALKKAIEEAFAKQSFSVNKYTDKDKNFNALIRDDKRPGRKANVLKPVYLSVAEALTGTTPVADTLSKLTAAIDEVSERRKECDEIIDRLSEVYNEVAAMKGKPEVAEVAPVPTAATDDMELFKQFMLFKQMMGK